MQVKPAHRPTLELADALGLLRKAGADMSQPFHILGIRHLVGGKSVRKVYDDVIALVTADKCVAFTANTDPNGFRAGHGTGANKGMAMLKCGVWPYTPGTHAGMSGTVPPYHALVQGGPVVVLRDADASEPKGSIVYEDGLKCYLDGPGEFGIHIHHGGETTTSSLGCQTIDPDQWHEFITMVDAHVAHGRVVQYVLVKR